MLAQGWRYIRSSEFTNLAMAFATVAIAVFTWLTYEVVSSGSQDTRRLITAAETQARAADKISGAADHFTDSAKLMEEHMQDAAKAMRDSVDTSDRDTKTTIKNAERSFRDEQRAWVGVQGTTPPEGFTDTEPWKVTVVFFNSGRTPARNVQSSLMFITSPVHLSGPSPDQVKQLTFRPAQSIAPQGNYRQAIGGEFVAEASTESQRQGKQTLISQYTRIKNKQLFLYYFGILKYDDIFGKPRETQFCISLTNPDTKEVGMCDAFNDLN